MPEDVFQLEFPQGKPKRCMLPWMLQSIASLQLRRRECLPPGGGYYRVGSVKLFPARKLSGMPPSSCQPPASTVTQCSMLQSREEGLLLLLQELYAMSLSDYTEL